MAEEADPVAMKIVEMMEPRDRRDLEGRAYRGSFGRLRRGPAGSRDCPRRRARGVDPRGDPAGELPYGDAGNHCGAGACGGGAGWGFAFEVEVR